MVSPPKVECRNPRGGGLFACVLLFGIWHSALGIAIVHAQEPPPLTAPVNDFAGVIDDRTERELDRRIRALLAASGDVVVVATVRTFKPYGDIESYAVRMFENGGRGIGARGKDDGLLIVVAVDDRRARIETGYDLEPFITDGFAGDTIRTVMGPRFAAGDHGGGILAGATRVINRIAERRGVALQDVPRSPAPAERRGTDLPIGLIIVLGLALLSLLGRIGGPPRRRRRRGPWIMGGPWSGWDSGVGPFGSGRFGGGFGGFGGSGGFGGGGGFGGFGGGRSGGGGASGSW